MSDLIERARLWIGDDPDPSTRDELEAVIEGGDRAELESRMDTALEFGTAGIRGRVGAGPGRMNRAVVIRTTYGVARYLLETAGGESSGPVVIGYDARPTSETFAEDAAGVFAAHNIPVLFFPTFTPTPLVAFAAKHLAAAAAVVLTASHNPPADNGYKVYGGEASQIVSPADIEIQRAIESAPPAVDIPRAEAVFDSGSDLVAPVPDDILDRYWEELSSTRARDTGSDLSVVYTPIHGVGRDTLVEVMSRAGHETVETVAEQADPDGTFPTVAFPNPEEPGALDLALDLARRRRADLVIANDPDADRLAAVIPTKGEWRPLSGNEIGSLLGEYLLANDQSPSTALVASSIVSSPMLTSIAHSYGARHELTLTGFKWIAKAGLELERETGIRFIFGYEEALGYSVGSIVRDKDGLSAAVVFTDLVADLADAGLSVMDRLYQLWEEHGLWVSAQTSIAMTDSPDTGSMADVVDRLGDAPPTEVGGLAVTAVTDYRVDGDRRPPWLGEQSLIELALGDDGRVLVRPSGTEPKLKIYVDLRDDPGPDPETKHHALVARAEGLGEALGATFGE